MMYKSFQLQLIPENQAVSVSISIVIFPITRRSLCAYISATVIIRMTRIFHSLFRALAVGGFGFLAACQVAHVDRLQEPGHVSVNVKDWKNAGIAGVIVQLEIEGSDAVWRTAITNGAGDARLGDPTTGIIPAEYNVKILPPAGYLVAPTQRNPIPITVESRQTTKLYFSLSDSRSGGPGTHERRRPLRTLRR